MNTQVKLITIMIASVLHSNAANATTVDDTNIEVITVMGHQQHYKIDQAHGAMRSDVSILDTPQSVVVIPKEIMDDQLVRTLADALKNDASISIGRVTTDRERFRLRGFSLDESTNLLKDGHQHFSKYRLPMALVENVEVLKGPSSLLYGQSTPGGLVNLVTKKPTYDSFLTLDVKGDENGSIRGLLDAGGSLNDEQTIRYRAVLEKEQNKNWREYQDGSAQESDFLVGSLMTDFDIGDNLTLSLHYDKSDELAGQDSGSLVDDNGDVIGGDEMIWDMPWTKVDAQSQNYGADMSYQLSDDWELAAGYNKQHNERERWESKPQTGSYDPNTGGYKNKPYNKLEDWQQHTFYFDIVGSIELAGMQHDILVGGNYVDHQYRSQKVKGEMADGNINTGVTIPQPDLDYADAKASSEAYQYYGVFAQDLISLNEQWQVLVGVRYDKQDKDNADSNSVLPKFGLIYHPVDNASIYANYSESFEPQGSVLDDDDGNYGLELNPITGKMIEFGTKWELLSGKVRLNAAVFNIERENILINTGTPDDPITSQGGVQRHRGFELGAMGEINDDLSLITSLMYLDAEYTSHDEYRGNRPEDVPEWTASIWAKYSLTDRMAVNLGAFYEGERFGDAKNTFEKDAYTRIDTGISYAMPLGAQDLQLRVNIENLFDTDYLGGGENGEVNVGKPRTLKFGVSYTF